MSVQRRSCPYCGALVLCNDATRTISHMAPQCDDFAQLMIRETHGRVTVDVEVLDVETGQRPGQGKPS